MTMGRINNIRSKRGSGRKESRNAEEVQLSSPFGGCAPDGNADSERSQDARGSTTHTAEAIVGLEKVQGDLPDCKDQSVVAVDLALSPVSEPTKTRLAHLAPQASPPLNAETDAIAYDSDSSSVRRSTRKRKSIAPRAALSSSDVDSDCSYNGRNNITKKRGGRRRNSTIPKSSAAPLDAVREEESTCVARSTRDRSDSNSSLDSTDSVVRRSKRNMKPTRDDSSFNMGSEVDFKPVAHKESISNVGSGCSTRRHSRALKSLVTASDPVESDGNTSDCSNVSTRRSTLRRRKAATPKEQVDCIMENPEPETNNSLVAPIENYVEEQDFSTRRSRRRKSNVSAAPDSFSEDKKEDLVPTPSAGSDGTTRPHRFGTNDRGSPEKNLMDNVVLERPSAESESAASLIANASTSKEPKLESSVPDIIMPRLDSDKVASKGAPDDSCEKGVSIIDGSSVSRAHVESDDESAVSAHKSLRRRRSVAVSTLELLPDVNHEEEPEDYDDAEEAFDAADVEENLGYEQQIVTVSTMVEEEEVDETYCLGDEGVETDEEVESGSVCVSSCESADDEDDDISVEDVALPHLSTIPTPNKLNQNQDSAEDATVFSPTQTLFSTCLPPWSPPIAAFYGSNPVVAPTSLLKKKRTDTNDSARDSMLSGNKRALFSSPSNSGSNKRQRTEQSCINPSMLLQQTRTLFPEHAADIAKLPCVSARLFAAYSLADENDPSSLKPLMPLMNALVEVELSSLREEDDCTSDGHDEDGDDDGSTDSPSTVTMPPISAASARVRRVHFAGFDGSSTKPPVDTLMYTERHQQSHVMALERALRIGRKLAKTEAGFSSLQSFFAEIPPSWQRACVDSIQGYYPVERLRKPARMYHDELLGFSSNDIEKPLMMEKQLAHSCSCVIRYLLRTMFNPPPDRALNGVARHKRMHQFVMLYSLSADGSEFVQEDDSALAAAISRGLRDVCEWIGGPQTLLLDSNDVKYPAPTQKITDADIQELGDILAAHHAARFLVELLGMSCVAEELDKEPHNIEYCRLLRENAQRLVGLSSRLPNYSSSEDGHLMALSMCRSELVDKLHLVLTFLDPLHDACHTQFVAKANKLRRRRKSRGKNRALIESLEARLAQYPSIMAKSECQFTTEDDNLEY